MATTNPFDLLGDDDTDDLTQLIAAQQQKPVPAVQPKKLQGPAAQPAKLPSKPIPPAQAGEPHISYIRYLFDRFGLNFWFVFGSCCDAL